MATINEGAVGTYNTLQAQFERDVEEKFTDLIGEQGKLTKFLSMTSDGDVSADRKEWGVTEHPPNYTTVRGAISSPTTNVVIPVNDGGVWGIGDIVLHALSGETARVYDTDNTVGAATVTLESRARGTTAAAAWASGDELYNLGSAKDQGDDLGEFRSTVEVLYQNPVQTYWERVEFTGQEIAINEKRGIYGGDYVKRKRAQTLTMMMEQMDIDALMGEAAFTNGIGTGTIPTLYGVRRHISSKNVSTIATLNQRALENYMAAHPNLRMGPDDLIVLCSDLGATGLNSYATERVRVTPGGKTLGYRLYEYITPVGTLTIMPHYQLSKGTAYAGLFMFLTKSELKKHVLRPLKFYGDIATGLKDRKVDSYLGAHTFSWGHPEHHGEINGVTAYA